MAPLILLASAVLALSAQAAAPATPAPLDHLTQTYVWATIIGVVGAWIGLGILIWQTISSRATTQAELRAYVLPDNTGIFDGTTITPPQPGRANTPGVAFTFKNSGRTPAYHVVSWSNVAVIPVAQEGTMLMVPPIVEQFATTLGPGNIINKPFWYDRPLNANEIADIGTGVRAVYLYGRIEYRDAFKNAHFSNFRLRYSGPIPPPASAIFFFSEHGNDSN